MKSNHEKSSSTALDKLVKHVDGLAGSAGIADVIHRKVIHVNTSCILTHGHIAAGSMDAAFGESFVNELALAIDADGHFLGEAPIPYPPGSSIKVQFIATNSGFSIFMIKSYNESYISSSSANALILNCDDKGTIIDLNLIAERYLSVAASGTPRGKCVLDFFDEVSRKSLEDLIKATSSGEGFYHSEAHFKADKDAGRRLIIQGVPIPGNTGYFTLVLHVLDEQLRSAVAKQQNRADLAEEIIKILKLEIEEHKRTQSKLYEAETYADSIISSSVDMIVSLNEEMCIEEFNRSAEKAFGYSKKEMEGGHISILLPDFVSQAVMLQVKESGSWEGRLTGISKKAEKLEIEVAVSMLKNQNGTLLGYVFSMRDVTQEAAAAIYAQEQQAKIEVIFNSGSVMFWTVNRNTALTSFNQEYAEAIYRLYGVYPEVNKDLFKPKQRFAPEHYHAFWATKYNEVFDSGKKLYFQTKTTDRSGKENDREIFLSPIMDTSNMTVKEVAGMAIDISEKKRAERKMNEQSAKIKAIFNASNHMIWSVDDGMRFTSFNEAFEKRMMERYGMQPEILGDAISFVEQSMRGRGEKWKQWYSTVFNGEKILFEELVTDAAGKEHLEEVSLNPIKNEEGKVVEIAALAQTVTFKRTAERKLKDQAAKINAIFDSTAMLIWTVDINLRIVSFNKIFADQHYKFLGKEISIGNKFTDELIDFVTPESMYQLETYFRKVFEGEKQQFEGIIYDKDKEKHWVEVFLNPIYRENGEIKEISCMSFEITDKKHIQQQMLESIHEKEILLQEVHHRVKNNLQVISSILNLQSSYVKDQNSLNILRESQNRIKSMSFIHESLYHTKDFSRIEFSDYILSLSNSLIHSYSIGSGRIVLVTKFDKVYLSLDQAIPSGLIVNELVSNALKYAFPNQESGRISLGLKEVEGIIELRIGDDGIGLPQDLDIANADSLGLQLVHSLIDQLDAAISFSVEKGTEYLITFEKQ